MGTTDTYSPYSPNHINPREFALTVSVPDVSTATAGFAVVPFKSTLIKVYSVIATTITGGAAATLTTSNNAGTSVTGGAVTIGADATAGTIDSATPTAVNTFAVGDKIKILSDGGSTTTSVATVTFVFVRTDA